jgi:hypothetical protein
MLHFQSLPYVSLKIVPSKEALPLFPSQNSHRDTPFPGPSFICHSKSWVKEPPPVHSPQQGSYGERCPFPEPSLTYLSESLMKELSTLSESAVKEPPSMFP